MLQHLPQLPVVVAFLIAFVASSSRIFTATRAFWGRFPAWFQMLAPQIALALGAIGQGLAGGVKSWTDLTVVFVGAGALLLPGLPSNRSAAPMQASKPVTGTPSAGDVAVAAALNSGSIRPAAPKPPSVNPMGPMGGMLALCLVLSLTGCGLLAAAAPYLAEAAVVIADAINDLQIVSDLIAKFPGLSDSTRATLEAKLQAAHLALEAAAAADNGAKDLTAAQLDASFTAFRAAWQDLAAALSEAGIVGVVKPGAVGGAVTSLPQPLALRPVVAQ